MSARATAPRATAPLAHFSGDDVFAIERAVARFAAALGDGEPLERWRVTPGEETGPETGASERRTSGVLERIEERVGTAPLFGSGVLVVVRQPGSLLRAARSRERVLRLLDVVPPGNGLCFTVVDDPTRRGGSKTGDLLARAVADRGGVVQTFAAPTSDRMETWIAARAGELGVTLGGGAARLLAERIGAFVRETDIDRRRQTELANGELEKLALYRPTGTVTREDVAELVPDAVPASTWALLDAVGSRRTVVGAPLLSRLLADGTPVPVLVVQLHRRLRELLVIREHLESGISPAQLPRVLKPPMQPFRAQKLAEQAGGWSIDDLERAFEGLLEVDLVSKGIAPDGGVAPSSDERTAMLMELWIAERVSRR